MNEDIWLVSSDLSLLLEFVSDHISERKLRLFGCACARAVWKDIRLKQIREGVEAAEQYADGLVTQDEFHDTYSRTIVAFANWCNDEAHRLGRTRLARTMSRSATAANLTHNPLESKALSGFVEDAFLSKVGEGLLRCIVGNPFNQQTIDRRWRTSDTIGLARAIYDERAFARLPILADALMDAGCEDEQIIAHCRSEGPHVRGCWVVDLVLGKS